MAKTGNTSVRFNPEHLDFAYKVTGLKKPQELIDKLLFDFYTAGNSVQNLFAGSKDIISFGFKEGELKTDNPAIISVLESIEPAKKKIVRSYNYFQMQLSNPFDTPQDHMDFIREVEESDLTQKQKNELIAASRVPQS